jgi:hypothetical protein
MSKRVVRYLLVLQKEQLKVGINDLPPVVNKKVTVAAASVLSTEAFLMVGLALQLEVPMVVAASIHGQKVGEECWNSGLDGHIKGCLTAGDPPHGITDVGHV